MGFTMVHKAVALLLGPSCLLHLLLLLLLLLLLFALVLLSLQVNKYRGADKSLAPPGRKQAKVTEGFEFHISYL